MGNEKKNDKTKQYKIKTAKVSNKKGSKKEENKKEKKARKKHPKLKKFIIICFVLFILLCLTAVGVFAGIFFSDKWKIDKEQLAISLHNTTVYDKDGKQIAELTGDENRKIITLAQMGDYLPNAFVAIEDERFYSHYGIDVKRTAGAIVTYITHGGKSSFGGSTITQQLVKNIMVDKEDSIERKIREWSRAYQVEQMLSKSQILELYLNVIFMGSTVYGVESGSQYYFSKSAKDLDLAEAAFIAGINDAPNGYNPFGEKDNSEKIKKRTKTVLAQMKKLRDANIKEAEVLKKITDEDFEKANQEVEKGLKFKRGSSADTSNISYHTAAAIDQVAKDLAEEKELKYDVARSMIYGGGYKLYTTQDGKIQKIMEKEYVKEKHIRSSRTTKGKKNKVHSQSAMVIIDHKTGQVVGCVGGLGKDSSTLGLNRALASNPGRQPGSSIKPLVVGAALEEKVITAATIYNDVRTNFGYGYINNASGYRGYISVRQGIECSSNNVNMKILSNLGTDKGRKYYNEFGLSYYTKEDESVGMAIGGTMHGSNPLQMAAAYATIANGGEYIEPTFYTKLESAAGKTVLEPKQEKKRILSEQNAYVLASILKSPVEGFKGGATARVCKISGMDTAAKTGTTSSYCDKWLCGFTPYYAAATWYGFDERESMQNFYNADSFAKNIWAPVMKEVHKGLKSAKFSKPNGIVTAKICPITGKVATSKCSGAYSEVFASGTVPTACEGHEEVLICKESKLLATEFCPETTKKANSVVPEKERNPSWKSSSSKNNLPTETCTLHTEETAPVSVPNVIGKTETAAKDELIGLNIKVITGEDKTKANGVVLRQSLAAGTSVKKGTTITITVNQITSGGNTTTPEPKPDPKPDPEPEPKPDTNTTTNTTNKPKPEDPINGTVQ